MTNRRKFIIGFIAAVIVGLALLAVQAWMTPDATVSHDVPSRGAAL